MPTHRDRVLDQFTRQAEPFSKAPSITDQAALTKIVAVTGAGPSDDVLDVACGPGIVACAFARIARHVTGIDITPAMIDRARSLAVEQGLANTTFRVGDVEPLPFGDGEFSVVVSRLAFHHLEQPAPVLLEMRRVCRAGGVVAVVDLLAPDDPERARAGNEVERLRDPSHARSLTRAELFDLFRNAGLGVPEVAGYRLELELESWLARSFPDPKDVGEITRRFEASLVNDVLGLGAYRDDVGRLRFGYDVAIFVARRAET